MDLQELPLDTSADERREIYFNYNDSGPDVDQLKIDCWYFTVYSNRAIWQDQGGKHSERSGQGVLSLVMKTDKITVREQHECVSFSQWVRIQQILGELIDNVNYPADSA